MLTEGRERAKQLAAGEPKWTTQTGLVVRGYRSKIDGSVQPYGLVVPASWSPNSPHKFRMDLWWHGRGEKLTELSFINDREKNRGEFTPPDTIVLHPYGRYCNANKFAGEVDTFEAMDNVKKHYKIDEDRIVARGFSMGGAACWQFAVHFPSVWCAANPGAGFAETADFLKVFQNEKVQPTEWEKKLWHWYDATDYSGNLFNLPTVAYSGEIDKQKQAADMMAKALKAEGIELTHIIGPNTAHRYHPAAKKEVERRIDALAAEGRNSLPKTVKFTTSTLRYNRSYWVRIDAMEREWEPARVEAAIEGNRVTVYATNVAALTFDMGPGLCPLDPTVKHRPRDPNDPQIAVRFPPAGVTPRDGRYGAIVQTLPQSDRSWVSHWEEVRIPAGAKCHQRRRTGVWKSVTASKARSTTPSWTVFSWSARPARR